MRSSLYGGLCLTVLAVVLFATGCGDSDDALTKSEFLKQGNAICKKGNQEIDRVGQQTLGGNKEPTKAELTTFSEDTLIPVVQGEIDGLRDLEPPSDDEDQVNAILDEAQGALDQAKDDPTIFASNADPFKKANKLANDYGLTECGG
jgi:hypothetical protein